jgi:hypothetical protein
MPVNPETRARIAAVVMDDTKRRMKKVGIENLSKEELGALLFVLELPPDCCHKIGMGKPIGLGSICITPSLYLSKRKERYLNIENEWSIHITSSAKDGEKIEDFKQAFAKDILTILNQKSGDYSAEDLWKLDRMNELKKMLTFNHGIAIEKLKYMDLTDFTERKVLPKPTDV